MKKQLSYFCKCSADCCKTKKIETRDFKIVKTLFGDNINDDRLLIKE